MKKLIACIAFSILVCCAFAQNNNSSSILVRHDTTLLKASECEWIIKSLAKNNPEITSEIGKPIPLILLQSIEKGKLIAIDKLTNKPIPGKQIRTWGIGVDSMMVYDEQGNEKIKAIQRERSSDNISSIRIYQDWYFNVSTGKFNGIIKWIELMEDVHSQATGIFLGHVAICRIYY